MGMVQAFVLAVALHKEGSGIVRPALALSVYSVLVVIF